ncbi:MAG: ABC transporter ATP-binding protein [Termitinemataceae bacterium]
MIEVQNVSKTYARGSVKAVDNLNVSIPGGMIFGFLGPNGAGKTTTIRMITGSLRPDTGTILVNGYDIHSQPLEAKRQFGYVPDNPELFSKLKAYEYLNFLADIYGIDTLTRTERIEFYASLFEIKDVLHGSISSFSHGMKQKLFLIGSLIHDPDIWILDEPMVGLDPVAAFKLKELMRQRAQNGKTVFFSTHVMEVAEKLCDRLAIINKGQLVFIGSLEELKAFQKSDTGSLEQLFLQLVDSDNGGAS